MHVVILGSAPLLMQSGLSESLTGRFEPIRVPHWSFAEMAAAFGFDLQTYLYFGGYPGAAGLARDEERWRNYVLGGIIEPTVERDLLALTRVDKPVLLKRLVELAAAHSGQVLSYTKMLGQLWQYCGRSQCAAPSPKPWRCSMSCSLPHCATRTAQRSSRWSQRSWRARV